MGEEEKRKQRVRGGGRQAIHHKKATRAAIRLNRTISADFTARASNRRKERGREIESYAGMILALLQKGEAGNPIATRKIRRKNHPSPYYFS